MEDNSLLKSRFLSLYCMVMADGIVEARELEVLYRIGRENYNISPEEINKMIVSAGPSFTVSTKMEERISILYEMSEIAWADGVIDESEVALLARYAVKFGFKEQNARGIAEFMIQQIKDGVKLEDVVKKILNS